LQDQPLGDYLRPRVSVVVFAVRPASVTFVQACLADCAADRRSADIHNQGITLARRHEVDDVSHPNDVCTDTIGFAKERGFAAAVNDEVDLSPDAPSITGGKPQTSTPNIAGNRMDEARSSVQRNATPPHSGGKSLGGRRLICRPHQHPDLAHTEI
jgi:hypothetical protein